MSTTNRRLKSHSTPQTPRIINLPRTHRTRRRRPRTAGNMEDAAERWRVQAEVLRAECEFLKMEKKLVMKKLEKNRVRIERSLKSALKSVDSGRRKMVCEGKKMDVVVGEVSEKFEELQSGYGGEVNGVGLILTGKSQNKSTDLSKGMLDQMERDYRPTINRSVTSSVSTSNRIDLSDHLSFSNRFYDQAKEPFVSQTSNKCSGRCKMLVRKMAEQVRADTEQWSQMQVMLGQLRQEMEELQTSKSFWETQALVSNQEIQSLVIEVEEWREKAVGYETKADTLQEEVNLMKGELEKLKKDQVKEIESKPKNVIISLSKQIEREAKNGLSCRMKGQCDAIVSNRHEKVEQGKKEYSPPLSLAKQLAREKRIMISRMTENPPSSKEILSDGRRNGCYLLRSPFKDIGNSSSSMGINTGMGMNTGTDTCMRRQNSNLIFPVRMED